MANETPPLGTWARAGELVGLVSHIDGDRVTVFSPGQRQQVTVPTAELTVIPASALTVTVAVDLPVPHGLGEDELRRWVSSLVDDSVRQRAYAALSEGELDVGPALPGTELSVRPSAQPGALCLCGQRTPAQAGEAVICTSCGRQAVSPPRS